MKYTISCLIACLRFLLPVVFVCSAPAYAITLCVDGVDVSTDLSEEGECLIWERSAETRIPESKGSYLHDTSSGWPGLYFILNDDWENDPFLVNFPDTATLQCEEHDLIFANKHCGLHRYLNVDNILTSGADPLTYVWNGETDPLSPDYQQKIYTDKTTPSNRVELGMTRANLFGVDDEKKRHAIIDALADAGIKTLVMNMTDVIMYTGDPQVPVVDHYLFERVMETIRYGKSLPDPMQFVMVILPPNDFYKFFVVYKDNRDFYDLCGWRGAYPFTLINTGQNTGELPSRLDWAFQRFADVIDENGDPVANPDPLTNIVGIVYGNELDSACSNGNVPYPGANDQPYFGEKQAFSDHYAKLVTIVKEKMVQHLATDFPGLPLISYGGTKTYQRDANNIVAWDNYDLLERIFASQYYGNGTTVTDPIDIIGQHVYPDILNVDTDLVNILYSEISQLNNSSAMLADGSMTVGQLASSKDIWLTEWGFDREPKAFAHTLYEPQLRYRSMMEVMEHINLDSHAEAQQIKKVFQFGLDGGDFGVFHNLHGNVVPAMPEFRVVSAYVPGVVGQPSGNVLDSDNDGLDDTVERNHTLTDPLQADSDFDGLLDGLEVSWDGVTVSYPLNTDPWLEDTDGDGLADGWENFYGFDPVATNEANLDTDGDGLTNLEEYLNLLTPIVSTSANYDNSPPSDLDWDGLSDYDEVKIYGTHPRDDDTDDDYILDGDEILIYQSDPLSIDSDGDGLLDEIEVLYGYALNNADTDGDCGVNPDPDDPCLDPNEDYDGDTISNINEYNAGMEIDVYNDPNLDSDGDTLTDGAEASIHFTDPYDYDSDNDSWLDNWEVNNFQTDPNSQDTDGDLVKDHLDNCPLQANREQHDLDNDGTGNLCDVDYVSVKNDFNGDGIADSLWWNTTQQDMELWLLGGFDISGQYFPVTRYDNVMGAPHNNSFDIYLQPGEVIEGSADFNGDGMADVLIRNTANNIRVSLMDGRKTLNDGGSYVEVVGGGSADIYLDRTFMAAGDFNGDGRAEILWRSKWGYIEMTTLTDDATGTVSRIFTTLNTGGSFNAWAQEFSNPMDMNGDGKDDLVARRHNFWGDNYVLEMNGTVVTRTTLGVKYPNQQNWFMTGIGEFGNDETQSPGLNGIDVIFKREYNGNQPQIDFRFLTNASDGFNQASVGDLEMDVGFACSFGIPNYLIDGVGAYDPTNDTGLAYSEMLMRAPNYIGAADYTLILRPTFAYDELVDPFLDADSDMDPMVDYAAYPVSEDGTTPLIIGGDETATLFWRDVTLRKWEENLCN